MTPPLFRVDKIAEVGQTVFLDGAEGRHAAAALRLRAGEPILVGDGRGTVATCEISATEKASATAIVRELTRHARPPCPVTVVQALPKSERSELAVELATEAGVDRIIPWQAERCVARWTGTKLDKGHGKWVNAARAAAKQSRRAFEPVVEQPVDRAGLLDLVTEQCTHGARVLALHEHGAVPFQSALGLPEQSPASVVLIIGPEGGISDEELAELHAAGAITTVLGPHVLRTSTAAAVALGALGVLTKRWDPEATTLDPTTSALTVRRE